MMARALAIHNQIMRRRLKVYIFIRLGSCLSQWIVFQEFQGYEVRTEGDAFMVVFEDPINAINWALAAQVISHSKESSPQHSTFYFSAIYFWIPSYLWYSLLRFSSLGGFGTCRLA